MRQVITANVSSSNYQCLNFRYNSITIDFKQYIKSFRNCFIKKGGLFLRKLLLQKSIFLKKKKQAPAAIFSTGFYQWYSLTCVSCRQWTYSQLYALALFHSFFSDNIIKSPLSFNGTIRMLYNALPLLIKFRPGCYIFSVLFNVRGKLASFYQPSS